MLSVIIRLFVSACLLPCIASAAGSIRVASILTGEAAGGADVVISNFVVAGDVSNAILGVCVAGTGSGATSQGDWGGVNLDLARSRVAATVSVEIWYLRRPTPGTADITILPSSAGNYTAIAFVMEGVADAPPEANTDATGTATTLTGSVTTVSASAFVIDCLGAASSLSNPTASQAGQTERTQFNPTITTPVSSISDKQGAASPGSTSLGWSGLTTATRTVQVLAAFSAPSAQVRDIVGPGIIPGPR